MGFVILWFILPETKGIPLEKMGMLFGDEDETNLYDASTPDVDLPEKLNAANEDKNGYEKQVEHA